MHRMMEGLRQSILVKQRQVEFAREVMPKPLPTLEEGQTMHVYASLRLLANKCLASDGLCRYLKQVLLVSSVNGWNSLEWSQTAMLDHYGL